MTRALTLASTAALCLLAVACGPMDVEVVNTTGADLVLDMPDQQEIIPPGTHVFTYTGAPTFNKRWSIPVTVSGDYVLTRVDLDAERRSLVSLELGEADINAFVVEFENTTGERIDSLHVQHPSEASRPLEDGMRPGPTLGAMMPGETVVVPLEHRSSGYHFVYYQQGRSTVDTSGRLHTEAAGQDVFIAL